MIDRIDHIVLNCRNVETTAAWYERALGFRRETYASPAEKGERIALKFGRHKFNQFDAVHFHLARRHLDAFSLSRGLVGTLAGNFHGGKNRRHLQDGSREAGQHCHDQRA